MVTARERVALAWHAGSDHAADGAPFGGPLCNCQRVADRMMPMLADAWSQAVYHLEPFIGSQKRREAMADNPYDTEED